MGVHFSHFPVWTEEELAVWSVFLAAVASMQFHPGTKERMSIPECAAVADEMMEAVRCRLSPRS